MSRARCILSVIPVRWHVDDLVNVIHVCKKVRILNLKIDLFICVDL